MDDVRHIEWTEYGTTVIHPVALCFTLAMGLLLLWLRRSQAVLPFALVATLIPVAQRVVIATLDFNMMRILLLFGWARALARDELRRIRLNRLDVAIVVWLACGALVHVLREGTLSSFVHRLGYSFDAIGAYFLFRVLVRESRELVVPIRYLAWICLLVAVFMCVEWATDRNLFSAFGGVAEITPDCWSTWNS